jgi:hypothetical protein
VPVTAKLSKQFYDRLGEAVANELVDWFNQVDATYRSDLRDLNELNYARFEAKLEQRLAEFRREVGSDMSVLRADIIGLRGEITGLRGEITGLGDEITGLGDEVSGAHGKVTGLHTRMDVLSAMLTAQIETSIRKQTQFFFVAWAGLLIPILGLWLR